MYIENLTTGSVLLPNGRDLVTWLEVSDEELEQLKKYEGTLLKISKTKPTEAKKEVVGLPIEENSAVEGMESLAEAMKPAVVETETEVKPEVKPEPTRKKKGN